MDNKIVKFKSTDDFHKIRRESFWKISGVTKKCYDKDQQALFGSSTHKSSVFYEYIPAEHMEEGIPFIIGSGINYDGGKEQTKAVKEGAMTVEFDKLKDIFTLNSFK